MKIFKGTGILCLIGVILIIGSVSGAHLGIGNVKVNAVGGTATVDLILDTAHINGTSGYIIDLAIADPSVAEITAVTYNASLGGMTDTTDLPFSTGHIGWVDTGEVLQAPGGETDLILATLTVRGLSSGSTSLNTDMVLVTDDNGNSMIPQLTLDSPAITVGTGSSSGSSGDSFSGSSSSDIQTAISATVTGTATGQVTSDPTSSPSEATHTTTPVLSGMTAAATKPPATAAATAVPTTPQSIVTVLAGMACGFVWMAVFRGRGRA